MLAALIIVFREVLEAGLVVGVVMAATRGMAGRWRWIALGLLAGVAGACLVAAFAGEIASLFQGSGQEYLNAGVLIIAVVMLIWHNAWMAGHGRELAQTLRQVGHDIASGRKPLTALAVVCGVAVFREGSEIVLFLYGVLASGGSSAADIALGGALGIVAGALVSALLYLGLIAIPMRHLFATLTTLITLLAAGLASQAVNFLQQGGLLQQLADPLWDTSHFLPEDGILGRVLHTLIGYSDQPSGMQLIAYLATIAVMWLAMRLAAGARKPSPSPQVRES